MYYEDFYLMSSNISLALIHIFSVHAESRCTSWEGVSQLLPELPGDLEGLKGLEKQKSAACAALSAVFV